MSLFLTQYLTMCLLAVVLTLSVLIRNLREKRNSRKVSELSGKPELRLLETPVIEVIETETEALLREFGSRVDLDLRNENKRIAQREQFAAKKSRMEFNYEDQEVFCN